MNLEENLRTTIPEIQPLQDNKDIEQDVPELPDQKKQRLPFVQIKNQVIIITYMFYLKANRNLLKYRYSSLTFPERF